MTVRLRTTRLELVAKSREDVQAMIDAMTPYEKAQMSADWLARFHGASEPSPWVFGFKAVRLGDGVNIGTGGFAAPPSNGLVEIAYAVAEEYRGQGYATEIAQALMAFCFESGEVDVVRAHTLPDGIASQRILAKCGFKKVGEIDDPTDGRIWRFEKSRHE